MTKYQTHALCPAVLPPSISAFLFAVLIMLIAACSTPGDTFRIEGKFKNFNQGELYVYSIEVGGSGRLDTIRLNEGRFRYEIELKSPMTMAVVFPNYSEIPVFAEPGKTVRMEGDASHLKETEVSGTDNNELMTQFRMAANERTPPEVLKSVEQFVDDHPQSPVSLYLVNKYFLQKPDPDYAKAADLLKRMASHEKKDSGENAMGRKSAVEALRQTVEKLRSTCVGKKLPAFSDKDTKGRKVDNTSLNGDVNIIYTWASWNYESQNTQRLLKKLHKEYGSKLSIIGVSLDARPADISYAVNRDSITWSQICNGMMWETPLLQQVGLTDLPGNIVTDRQGKIIERNLSNSTLDGKIRDRLRTKL